MCLHTCVHMCMFVLRGRGGGGGEGMHAYMSPPLNVKIIFFCSSFLSLTSLSYN